MNIIKFACFLTKKLLHIRNTVLALTCPKPSFTQCTTKKKKEKGFTKADGKMCICKLFHLLRNFITYCTCMKVTCSGNLY